MNTLNYYVIFKSGFVNKLIWHLLPQEKGNQCIFFDMQRPKRRPIEILVENETTEQMNNETAQQVSERNLFWLWFTGNGDISKFQQNNFLVSVCVCNLYLSRQVS